MTYILSGKVVVFLLWMYGEIPPLHAKTENGNMEKIRWVTEFMQN